MANSKNQHYTVSITVSDNQGKQVFAFNSSTFNEKDLKELETFLFPELSTIEEDEIENFPGED